MKRLLFVVLVLVFLPQSVLAWNNTGHEAVAGIAWDNMTVPARENAIALLRAAPSNACLLDLFSNDNSRPLAEREREFFMRASTWPDVVRRRGDDDDRPCTEFHRGSWHFINFFWSGTSGTTGATAPRDRRNVPMPEMNAVDRLTYFRSFVACATSACGTTAEQRATTLAWILHLVGDIHQPLHTSGRVTTEIDPDERQGDRGGNQFKLAEGDDPPSLHGFWDGILNTSIARQPNESQHAYVNRVIGVIAQEHPRSAFANRMLPGQFDAWAREGFETTKRVVYPATLVREVPPESSYRQTAFTTSKPAIALAGYRLADLLNRMLGP